MGARTSLRPPAGPVLLESKLRPPPVRAGLIPRVRLDAMLDAGTRARLCLIDAPAGSGKTTLLAQWCLADEASRRVAWVSLDESDDDPVRFWVYVIEAFRVVAPGFGEAPLGLLQGSGTADVLTQVVLPQLLNELATGGGEGRVAATAAMVFSADDTCDVGMEGGAVVSEDYGPRGNEFTGEVNWVQIDLDAAAEDLDHLITPEERLHIAMARQ